MLRLLSKPGLHFLSEKCLRIRVELLLKINNQAKIQAFSQKLSFISSLVFTKGKNKELLKNFLSERF